MKLLTPALFISTIAISNGLQITCSVTGLENELEGYIKLSPISTLVQLPSEINDTTRDDIILKTYEAGTLRFREANGICEKTPGVYQASGYAALTPTEHMWFWFFSARENPDTAPLAIWINGGPGASSMISLFHGNGPCHLTDNGRNVMNNSFSWNNKVNMLYVDQPIGSGFSHGRLLVNRTSEAGEDMWKFLQIFFSHPKFHKYQERELGIWSESYGGHYVPYFAYHFLEQNGKIRSGKLKGKLINVAVIGIGNGLTDVLYHYPGYFKYARSNPYRTLADAAFIQKINARFLMHGGCRTQIMACQTTMEDSICKSAHDHCGDYVWGALSDSGYFKGNPYFIKDPDLKHTLTQIPFFDNEIVKEQIGSEVPWKAVNMNVSDNFYYTGDMFKSHLPDLQHVISAGIRTILYVGDADYVINYHGVESMLRSLHTKNRKQIIEHKFIEYNVSNEHAGMYQSEENLHYLRVFDAGHAVQNYTYKSLGRGQVAEQMFNQMMFGQPLSDVTSETEEQTKEREHIDL